MPLIYDPVDRGFTASLSAVDRCQIAMLRELAHLSSAGRLILKGGMAMRTTVGSMRLTKDIDFDRGAGISTAAARNGIKTALERAASWSGLRAAKVDTTKETDTTLRMRLTGALGHGATVNFVVEVSGRHEVPQLGQQLVLVEPPRRYAMTPFKVMSYTHDLMAASKVLAVMSDNRNVPRDIFDLHDLAGANPAAFLAERVEGQDLEAISQTAIDKIQLISFAQAQTELLPYLPLDIRESQTESTWDDMLILVADRVSTWAREALAHQQQAGRTPTPDQRSS